MSQEPLNLLDAALQLPMAERGQLAARLIESTVAASEVSVRHSLTFHQDINYRARPSP